MNFLEIAENRQSCRSYDSEKAVEPEKLDAILRAAQLAPSACNGQPYKITVCTGENAKAVAAACAGMGINKFAPQVPVQLVISEMPYSKSAALGAKLKGNDYRSMDIGIVSAYITLEAAALGLGTCILGWFNEKKIKEATGINSNVRLVITLGYPREDDVLRDKKRKDLSELVKSFFLDEKINLGTEAVISTARQNAALTRALDFVNLSIEAIAIGIPQDAVSADIERALGAISELDGRQVNEEVVSDIFSKFCVGK